MTCSPGRTRQLETLPSLPGVGDGFIPGLLFLFLFFSLVRGERCLLCQLWLLRVRKASTFSGETFSEGTFSGETCGCRLPGALPLGCGRRDAGEMAAGAGAGGCTWCRETGEGRAGAGSVEELDARPGFLKSENGESCSQRGSLFLNLRHWFISRDLYAQGGRGGCTVKDKNQVIFTPCIILFPLQPLL